MSSRAAQIAARVAARYASAPSYVELQAEEARVAVRAAEIATQVALEAQAAAETALAELHAAAVEPPMRGPAVVEVIDRGRVAEPEAVELSAAPEVVEAELTVAAPERAELPPPVLFEPELPLVVTQETVEGRVFDLRWEPDLPMRAADRVTNRGREELDLNAEDWWTPAHVDEALHHEPLEVAETQPEYANLIEFPRELVAPRKMRPRLPDAQTEPVEKQLSIFEVDPGSVSTEPEPEVRPAAAPEWNEPRWQGIELDAHPAEPVPAKREPEAAEHGPYLAPLGRRMLAWATDFALFTGAFAGAAIWELMRTEHLPALRQAEGIAGAALVLGGLAYYALFLLIGISTPGMHYAGIALCTFDDEVPTRAQLRRRLLAMMVSLLPVGLGLVWAVFDEDHLSWHDRISQTYLRKR